MRTYALGPEHLIYKCEYIYARARARSRNILHQWNIQITRIVVGDTYVAAITLEFIPANGGAEGIIFKGTVNIIAENLISN